MDFQTGASRIALEYNCGMGIGNNFLHTQERFQFVTLNINFDKIRPAVEWYNAVESDNVDFYT
jgi:hypothetical protein